MSKRPLKEKLIELIQSERVFTTEDGTPITIPPRNEPPPAQRARSSSNPVATQNAPTSSSSSSQAQEPLVAPNAAPPARRRRRAGPSVARRQSSSAIQPAHPAPPQLQPLNMPSASSSLITPHNYPQSAPPFLHDPLSDFILPHDFPAHQQASASAAASTASSSLSHYGDRPSANFPAEGSSGMNYPQAPSGSRQQSVAVVASAGPHFPHPHQAHHHQAPPQQMPSVPPPRTNPGSFAHHVDFMSPDDHAEFIARRTYHHGQPQNPPLHHQRAHVEHQLQHAPSYGHPPTTSSWPQQQQQQQQQAGGSIVFEAAPPFQPQFPPAGAPAQPEQPHFDDSGNEQQH